MDPHFKKHCFQNGKACSDLKDLAGIISIQNTSTVPSKDDTPITVPPSKKITLEWFKKIREKQKEE